MIYQRAQYNLFWGAYYKRCGMVNRSVAFQCWFFLSCSHRILLIISFFSKLGPLWITFIFCPYLNIMSIIKAFCKKLTFFLSKVFKFWKGNSSLPLLFFIKWINFLFCICTFLNFKFKKSIFKNIVFLLNFYK